MGTGLSEHTFEVALALSLVLAQYVAGPHGIEGSVRLIGCRLGQHGLTSSCNANKKVKSWISYFKVFL